MVLTRDQHLYDKGKKRILALDGGGVRGLITLGFLARIEELLAERFEGHYRDLGKTKADFRLCHYFDLIGGASTGGIIATLLCLGQSVERIRQTYFEMCKRVFAAPYLPFLNKVREFQNLSQPKFDSHEFELCIAEMLKRITSEAGQKGHGEPLLESDLLQTGLGIVTKRIDTGSVWVLTNNRRSKFWDPDSGLWPTPPGAAKPFFANRRYPLRTLVQATASAPFFLNPVPLAISPGEEGVFLDGGATPHNNPALELFLTATLQEFDAAGQPHRFSPFGFDWETGADNIFVCSVGTGTWRSRHSPAEFQAMQNWQKAKHALTSIIDDGMKTSLMWLQAMSEAARPWPVDSNLADMRNLRVSPHKQLTFHRADVTLETSVLKKYLGGNLKDRTTQNTRELDNADNANLARLDELGRNVAAREVFRIDLPLEFDPYPVSS